MPQESCVHLKAIERHLEEHIGKPAGVFHELISDQVHLDVHVIEPARGRDYYTLVTSGMSDRPMNAPAGAEAYRYAELLICLSRGWSMEHSTWEDERNYWPIRWLKILARLPHEYDTWLFTGHTVPHGDPPEPFAANTKLCCAMLAPPVLFGEEFRTLAVNEETTIHFLALLPLYREEVDFKLEEGFDALYERLEEAGVTELLNVRRRNVCR
jgi:hypothetical protein